MFGCGGDSSSDNIDANIESNDTYISTISAEVPQANIKRELDYPKVRVEELDHSQEFFKEQHTTSFSYIPRKNWTSYTASKEGLLTKVLFFGKANLIDSPHYGLSMSGFVRANNPNSGPQYGRWSITRDDIVSQLAAQGLGEREAGWLTIRMRGEVPQNIGTRYFLVCDNIGENKAWFGEFSFAEANPYELGSHWLNQDHDLVMRTYVGKTDEQMKALQLDPQQTKSIESTKDLLSVPVSQNPQKSLITPPTITSPLSPYGTETKLSNSSESLVNDNNSSEIPPTTNVDQNRSKKKTMFDRLFKKDKRD